MLFQDRVDAGRRLAAELEGYRGRNLLVLGIPRGGVAVAFEVARALNAPLDVTVARKVPAPDNPELAIGAVAADGTVVMDPLAAAYPGINPEYVSRAVADEVEEIHRRLAAYRGDRPPADPSGRTTILIDDGIATGNTVLATLRMLRKRDPLELIVAVPVAPPMVVDRLRRDADRVVTLATPEDFIAVGQWYRDFSQLSDDEVVSLLELARGWGTTRH
ncbi:MAG: phosphoribosyltransferase [Armatimonadota bacterium]|nr:phosphoribosyltransferase [Armatimonadota bacterium]